MIIETVKKLHCDGTLTELFKAGFISSKLLFHYNCYLEYDKLRRLRKYGKMQAYNEVGVMFGLHEISVCRIVKKFEDE